MNRLQGRYSSVKDQSLDTFEARYEEGFGYHSQYHYAPNPPDLRHEYEDRSAPRSAGRQYKPTALRWPFLVTLLVALLTTLGFLSYAVTSLPVVGSKDASDHVEARDLVRARAVSGSDTSAPTQTTTAAATTTTLASSDESITAVGTRAPGDYGQIGTKSVTVSQSTSTAPGAQESSDFGDIGSKTITVSDPSTTTRARGSSDSIQTPTFASSRAEGDYGNIGTKTITESGPSTTTRLGDSSDSAETPTIASSRAESDYGNIGSKTITESGPSITTPADDSSDSEETPTFASSPAQSDFGRIGTKTVSGAVPETTGPVVTGSKPESDFGNVGSKTVNEQPASSTTQIETITHVTLGVTTITNEAGSPITTSTQTPSIPTVSTAQTSTLTNSAGKATATQVVTVLVTPSTSIATDSAGNPTATILTYPVPLPPSVHTAVYNIDGGHYFMGTFLPTVVASILAIAVRVLDANAKSFQPWHALTHERGASGRESLLLQTGGWRSLGMGLRSLLGGQAMVFLASLLSLAVSLLIPVAAGAITLDLRGDGCRLGGTSASNCAYVLSVSPVVSKATIGLLATMSLATLLLIIMIGRWHLGVYTNPWSMCTLASLAAHPDVRRLVLDAADQKQARSQLKHQDFKLDYFWSPKGQMEYGIVALDRFSGTGLSTIYERLPLNSNSKDNDVSKTKHGPPFFMLGIIGRLCLLFLLSGVLVLVLYYARTGGDTGFERFIDSDSFSVQFLFTGLGVLISLFWFSFFGAVATMNSYQFLAEKPREARQSVLLAPPTNAFSGLWHAVRTRRIFLGLVSLASILSESLGIFLGNVRFQVTQTFFVWQLCTWTAVGIMSFMLLVLLASFFVKWPDMPVEPSTIAGAMYYLCDSSVIDRFDGLSTLNKKERDRTVTDMALLYEFNERMSAEETSSIGLKTLDTKIFMP